MATAGFKRFNENRTLMGLNLVTRNLKIDTAAQGHSDYQARDDVITHDQTPGNPGFTGAKLEDDPSNADPLKRQGRLSQAGYNLVPSYAIGEVISRTSNTDGVAAADALIAAIYHRFVIFEPMFKEAGAGATSRSNGSTYFTTDFAANNGLDQRLGAGNFAVYPYDKQQLIPISFDHGSEEPDAFPKDQFPEFIRVPVGYPISVHADIIRKITITEPNFTIRPRYGAPLKVRLLTSSSDPHTPLSAASIIPLAPLAAGTTYDVVFSGSICTINAGAEPPDTTCISSDTAVSRNWSFTTK